MDTHSQSFVAPFDADRPEAHCFCSIGALVLAPVSVAHAAGAEVEAIAKVLVLVCKGKRASSGEVPWRSSGPDG